MVVTVNPNTQTILLTSIPRDYYVTTVCDVDDGCQNGAMDKLTHTGMNGVNTTKMTIENLLGIEINYTFKVGFDSVTEVVNALGGIDVNVPEEAAVASSTQTKGFSIAAGQQHIDGTTALNFSRERYAYVDGDRQRTRNQQIVLMGIIDAVTSPSVLMNYTHPSGLIGEDPRGVPNNLMPYISQTAIGRLKCLSVFGVDYDTPDGTGVRDYIHVMDLARGHVAAIAYMAEHPGESIFNLGTGKGYSVLEMVHAFETANHVHVPYRIAPRRAGDLPTVYACPDKSARILGWRAQYSLEDMCRDSWHWQTQNPNGYETA